MLCSWLGHVTVPTFYAIFVHVHDYHLSRLFFWGLEGIVWMKCFFQHPKSSSRISKCTDQIWWMVLGSHHFPKLWRNVSADFCSTCRPADLPRVGTVIPYWIHSKAHSLQHFMDCNKDSLILWYWSENLYVGLMIKTYEYGLDVVPVFTNILSSVC